ncbi:hypothetical protein [Luteimonas sp. MC1750]|uniref:hypothetical protein n=1 Tax=Luteimonas sp. MC1750 TaxID=2799326 RepID=UPI0018F0921C|nr:hypothetical protein [Luteimonas sp. MC1750]MBJ6984168.1 hypothetical protein [Luteimonas sp. MC1750]QQO07042.1 hypothetical protein JGR68_06420 [Luteimonas sp. MC1750]
MRLRRGLALAAGIAVVVLLLVALAAAVLMQPRQLARIALGSVGDALGLDIGFEGEVRYRLRGTPLLEVHDVVARAPGGGEPLLRAGRVLVSLPWSTLRDRGAPLVLERIELDAPVLELARLQAWLAGRPPGAGRLPTLSDGIGVRDGRLLGEGWTLAGLDLDVALFAEGQPVAAGARGILELAAPLRVDFDLRLAATRPANGTGVSARGKVQIHGANWRLPAFVAASGPLRFDDGVLRVAPLKLGMSAEYRGGGEPLRFTLGAHGPLRLRDGIWTLVPAAIALRGKDLIPDVDAHGRFAFGDALLLELDGAMPAWPATWPALPAPLGTSTSPLAATLVYAGARDASDPVGLHLRRDGAQAVAGLRIADVLTWMDAAATGSPLPPLHARASAPRIEIAGAVLEGVEVELEPGDAP